MMGGFSRGLGLMAWVHSPAAADTSSWTPVYRISNGSTANVPAIDGGIAWARDYGDNPSPYLSPAPGHLTYAGTPDAFDESVPSYVPSDIWLRERWGTMYWEFPVTIGKQYRVRIFLMNYYSEAANIGDRIFDIAIEGTIIWSNFDVIATFGHRTAGCLEHTVTATGGILDVDFLVGIIENPFVNGIEIAENNS